MKIIITDCDQRKGFNVLNWLLGRKAMIGLMSSTPSIDITIEYRSPEPERPMHHYLGADA